MTAVVCTLPLAARRGLAAAIACVAFGAAGLAGADVAAPARAPVAMPPEIATGYAAKPLVRARRHVAVTAHPIATEAAREILARGGSAIDAAIAAQLVLNVVEPQSSGIGGGGFLLHHDAVRRTLRAYDGRETAPAAATENDLRWIDRGTPAPPRPSPRESGRSIGTPGLLHLLDGVHREAGTLPWRALFEPAIRAATDGFTVTPRLASSIAASAAALAADPETAAQFLDAAGRPRQAGTRMTNHALAATLRRVADEGIGAFYAGETARDIVDEVRDAAGGRTPGSMTLADLAAYRSVRREPLCARYRVYRVCGMPPPSSGGLAVAQTLGILEAFDLASLAPAGAGDDALSPLAVHLVSEAQRLAYADRDRYVADPAFAPLPAGGVAAMLDRGYLLDRAGRIDLQRSMGRAMPGEFGGAARGDDARAEGGGTTHITIVDGWGSVAVLTSSIESAFGSYRTTRGGFLLNNQLTDFAAQPHDDQGRPVANRIEPGKRPRSSMAPTIVFDHEGAAAGHFVMATGSPGGAAIIHYVVKALVGTLDWRLDPSRAAALPSFGAFNAPATVIGSEHPRIDATNDGAGDPLVAGLRALGHTVVLRAQSSGLATVVRVREGSGYAYEAAADPRREGQAAAD